MLASRHPPWLMPVAPPPAYSSINHAGFIVLGVQAGIPLTFGFFARFYVLEAAAYTAMAAGSFGVITVVSRKGSTWLAIVAVLTAVISAFVYLRIIVSMFMTAADELPECRTIPIPTGARIALALSAVVTLLVGVFPSLLSEPAGDATPALMVEPVDTPHPRSSSSRSDHHRARIARHPLGGIPRAGPTNQPYLHQTGSTASFSRGRLGG